MNYVNFQLPAGTVSFEPPVRQNGEPYRFTLLYGDNGRSADTFSDLIGLLIPGYDDLGVDEHGDDEATIQRFYAAQNFAELLQASYNAQADANGALEECSGGEFDELFAPKHEPFEGRYSGSNAWDADVPMVCVEGHYAPWTDLERPTGSIVWVLHVEEAQFVQCLAELGMVGLFSCRGADEGGADM